VLGCRFDDHTPETRALMEMPKSLAEAVYPGYNVNIHCNENPIYVFTEKEWRGLSPSFHIRVSVSDIFIPRIGPNIFLQQNRQTDPGNI
jgi:hypothetical protein